MGTAISRDLMTNLQTPMLRTDPFVVLTKDGAAKIAAAPCARGGLLLRHSPSEDLYVVKAVDVARGTRVGIDIPKQFGALHWGDESLAGEWMRQPIEGLNVQHLLLIRRPGTGLSYDEFRKLVPGLDDPGAKTGLLITYEPDLGEEFVAAGGSQFAGWLIDRDLVRPIHVAVEPDEVGVAQLAARWPVNELAGNSVMLVGCGSIGGAIADALGGYGVGRLELVDPDRFLWHNMVRHLLGPEHVGQYKVDALKMRHEKRWLSQQVVAHRLDVVTDAHHIRPLLERVDLVVCAADGIAPRRVVSHLARRAGKPAVMACVLDHGAIGEVIRLRPSPRFGCLLCLRAALHERGAMDAEADQELDYGTGFVHQPMTAVPPDLHLIGILAAKVAVATLLESQYGEYSQRLPGEHAIVGLQPRGDLVSPFDLTAPAQVTWASIVPPRPTCPTCNVA